MLLTQRGVVFRSRTGAETVRLGFAGARKPEAIEGLNPTGGTSNYFFGPDSANWRTNIPNYSSVRYKRLYEGIDLVFRASGRRAEYDFLVAPEADPAQIELDFTGARSVRLSSDGDLIVGAGGFEVVHRKPLVYQSQDGARREVEGNFVLRGEERVAFELGEYDRTEPLVIDPMVSYSAIVGGSGTDIALAIATDAAGNAYVSGNTSSSDFPYVTGSLRTTSGGGEAFVYKLDPTGTTLLYSALIANASGNAIAVDAGGNAYVAGGNGDALVFKLNAAGSALLYSFSFGGTYTDSATGIAIDSTGNAYVTGITSSANFPTTAGALRTSTSSIQTGFVAKVNPAGTALLYSTFLGGSGSQFFQQDAANAIAIDAAGNAYIAGSTTSSDFPVVAGSFQTDTAAVGLGYGFLAKLNPGGSALVYSTLLEGGSVSANGVAVDSSGNAYVSGSSNYLTMPNVPTPSGLFVLKLNPGGTAPVYVTLVGSSHGAGAAIAIDAAGDAYVTGWTTTSSFPVVVPIQAFLGIAETIQGSNVTKNAAVAEIDPSGNIIFSTYLGGQNNGDWGNAIAVGPNGTAYVAGRAGSLSFPVTPGAAGKISGDGFDTFVTAVNFSSGCSFSVSPATAFPASGGSGSMNVSTQAQCGWIAISNQPWITITSGPSGFGPGTVGYSVASNVGPQRSAPLSIAGLANTVSQASGCAYSLSSGMTEVPVAGGMVTVNLNTGFNCTYNATVPPSWIIQDAGWPYSGSTQFVYTVTANTTGAPRSATLTLAGLPFVINQDGGSYTCPFTLGSNVTFGSYAQLASVQVTATSTCSWSAVSNTPWLYVVSVGSAGGDDPVFGTGSGFVNFRMDANPGPGTRVGTITIAGLTYTATQAGLTIAPSGVGPAAGSGLAQTFSFTFTDAAGFADLSVLDVLISTFLDGQTACYFALAPTGATTGYIYLVDDAGDGGYAGAPMPLPSTGVVQNSQCSISATGSSVSANGNTLTLTLAITFKAGFGGNKAVYMAARSSTQNSGWQALGTWNVPGTPTGPAVGTVSPARSTSTGQTYTFTFTDSNGYADLFVVDVLTNSFLVGNNACYFAYVPTTPTNGYLYLVDDAGDGGYVTGSPIALLSGGTLQNSQCILNTSGSSASGSGNTLTLNLAITFTSGFVGNHVFYLAARNNSTGNSGWQAAGSVTVP